MSKREIILEPTRTGRLKVNDDTIIDIGKHAVIKAACMKNKRVKIYVKTNGDIELSSTSSPINTDNITLLKSYMEKPKVDKTDPAQEPTAENNIMSFLSTSVDLRPERLKLSDIKWKYLVRSILRGKNILMTGDAGCGKTMAARSAAQAMDRTLFYFNLGATQDPRATLIGNTHFKKDNGTYFSESVFVKAIQTENSVILLDEISRAHPEAWNILMTVLDEGQRYLRLDEADGAPTIKVAKGVSFIATANIGNQYTSTRILDRAIIDRFTIIEMDLLDKEQESGLIKMTFPDLEQETIENIAEIASLTRLESRKDNARISTAISTRIVLEIAGLINDGFSLEESAAVAIYPFYSEDGGLDSERTFIKQLVQKFTGKEGDAEALFGTTTTVEESQF